VAEFARYLKVTPTAEGSSGVLYPSEVEHMREQERRKNGIDVEDATWEKLRQLSGEYGLLAELGFSSPLAAAPIPEATETAEGRI
jgi:uncharacterized oxidoreductase